MLALIIAEDGGIRRDEGGEFLGEFTGFDAIAGGLGLRIANLLPRSGFSGRFTAKGRFERMLSAIPVKIITHPQPGLFGAAAAFAEQHGQ